MTELKKVTDLSGSNALEFMDKAAVKAKELGASMSGYINSVADWSRLGYKLDDAEMFADASQLYLNVGDDVDDINESTSTLISTVRAFKLEASDADTLIPVVSFSYPPQRGMVVEQERLVFKYPEYLDSRSQDLQTHYHDVGQFYVFRTDRFAVNKKLMVGNILPLIVSELEVQDIDNLTDWKIAEMKYRLMTEEK